MLPPAARCRLWNGVKRPEGERKSSEATKCSWSNGKKGCAGGRRAEKQNITGTQNQDNPSG